MIVVAIPAANEENTIAKVILQAKKHCDKVVVCDDGSTDMTGEIAKNLGAVLIKHKMRLGYGAALRDLFKQARDLNADYLITIDADGQHDPRFIPELLKPLEKDKTDITIGSRLHYTSFRIPKYRLFGIRALTKVVTQTSNLKIRDSQSGYRAYNRKALTSLLPAEAGMGAGAELLLKAEEKNLRVKEVPIKAKYDVLRPSSQNPIYHGLDVISSILKLSSIRHPLLFYGIPGFIIFIFGLLYGYWTIQSYSLQGKPITNIALISFAIVFIGLLSIFVALILFTITNVVKEER